MTDLMDRQSRVDNAVMAVVVIGLEPLDGVLSISDFQVAVQRLERAVRPWDTVVNLAPRTVGVVCGSLANVREVEAIAARLADVVRAPMAVGDDVHQLGACIGTAVIAEGETSDDGFGRAGAAMRQMREARRALTVPTVPTPR
jgi:predicted signal transduction protein with EAL and GGDEF domain